jgi:hypothetical protein
MSNTAVKQKSDSKRWNQAIEDAQDTIAKCERKIESMNAAIQAFEEAIEEGAPWPGDSAARPTTST